MQKTKIIVIEDEDDLRHLTHGILKSAGFDVASFSDDTMLSFESSQMADVYLIDVHLGLTSGLTICKKIKAAVNEDHKVTVIMVSAYPDLRDLATEACADDILAKPFSKHQLVSKIREHLVPSSMH
ncbi:MAG TPA: response regulator [Ohtaekwangia sp.]